MTLGEIVLKATAEVRLNGKRRGTAVLVDTKHLLTARHVINPNRREIQAKYTVFFPQSGTELNAEVVDFDLTITADIAVLRITEQNDVSQPTPINIWPDERLPAEVAAFGFPGSDKVAEGIWRHFRLSGRTASGLWQLRWEEHVGTFLGHSGGPVVDAATEQLVGIIISGSETAQLDRFIGIPDIARAWSDLQRPWKYAGESAQSHFAQRARGQRSRIQNGDFFRGRTAALNHIYTWLTKPPPGRPLVITGQPGSGKSAVLARAAISTQSMGGKGIVYHARDSSVDDFLESVASFIGSPFPNNLDAFFQGLQERTDLPSFTLMVDAIDEAHSTFDAHQIAESIAELSSLSGVHAVVATRPMAAGDRFAPNSILSRLLVPKETAPNLIDLDVPPYRDRQAIRAFAEALLSQHGVDNPRPHGAAWATYRARTDLRAGLAEIIADRAEPNFLVAALTASALSRIDDVIDYLDPSFEANSMPSSLGEALDKFYESIDESTRKQVKLLLTALAYAKGTGVSEDRWIQFATTLGYTVTRDDIDDFKNSPGADYLIQTESTKNDHTVRLFHQALVDQLRHGRPASNKKKIYNLLRSEVKSDGGWQYADEYITTHIADYAHECQQLSHLLDDPGYIGYANIEHLVSTLGTVEPTELPQIGQLILQEGLRLREFEPDKRLWLLAVSATHAEDKALRDKLLLNRHPNLFPEWAHMLGSNYRKLIGHKYPINSLAIGRIGRDDVIVAGGTDGTIRVWDYRGSPHFDPLDEHKGKITALTVGMVDGEGVIVSGSADLTLRIWDHEGNSVGRPFVGHTKPISVIEIINFDGEDALVSVAPKGEIIVWNPEGFVLGRFPLDYSLIAAGTLGNECNIVSVGYSNISIFSPVDGHLYSVPVTRCAKTAAAVGRWRHADVVVCGLEDGSVAIWRADGTPARSPLLGHEYAVRSLALGQLGGTEAIAGVNRDNNLIVWGYKGNILAEVWASHSHQVNSIAMGSLKGRDVLACAGDDRIVRLWDDRTLLSRGRTNRRGQILAFGIGMVEDSQRIVTASEFGLEFWNFDGESIDESKDFLDSDITALAVGRFSSGDVIATATKNRDIYIRDLDGALVSGPISGHTKKITAIAIGQYGGQNIFASACRDRSISVWSDEGTEIFRAPTYGKRGAVSLSFGRFGGRDSLIVLDSDQVVRVRDLHDQKWRHISPKLPGDSATCLSLCTIDGFDVVAVGCSDGRIRTWQAGQEHFRVSREKHSSTIADLAFVESMEWPVLISVAADGVLRLWHDMEKSDVFPISESASHLQVAGSRIVISSGPSLSMLRIDATIFGRTSGGDGNGGSFTSTSLLASDGPEDFADFALDTNVGGRGSDADYIGYARELLKRGDAENAVYQLIPHLADVPAAVCLAADAACASGKTDLVETVLPYLEAPGMRDQPSIQGRLFAVAIIVDRLDVATSALHTLVVSSDAGVKGLIRLLDGERNFEWLVYRRSALLVQSNALAGSTSYANYVSEIGAARLLAVCRRQAGMNLEMFISRRNSMVVEYWSWFDDEVENRLLWCLSNYIMGNKGGALEMLPYQVISVYEVCRVAAQEDHGLWDQLVSAISDDLNGKDVKIRRDFEAWGVYSDLAAAVIPRLSGLGHS